MFAVCVCTSFLELASKSLKKKIRKQHKTKSVCGMSLQAFPTNSLYMHACPTWSGTWFSVEILRRRCRQLVGKWAGCYVINSFVLARCLDPYTVVVQTILVSLILLFILLSILLFMIAPVHEGFQNTLWLAFTSSTPATNRDSLDKAGPCHSLIEFTGPH